MLIHAIVSTEANLLVFVKFQID